MLIIDWKGFQVMSILHRTYRVTRLWVIYLLNTRQGVWEKITEKVSDTEKFRTAESYRKERSSDKFRWYRKVVSGYTIKSNWFRHMPDNSWRMPESFWKLFGIFWDKNRKCSETIPVLVIFICETHLKWLRQLRNISGFYLRKFQKASRKILASSLSGMCRNH